MYGADGVLYKDSFTEKTSFTFVTKTDIQGTIANTVTPLLSKKSMVNYFLTNFPKTLVADPGEKWLQQAQKQICPTGKFVDSNSTPLQVGSFTASALKFIEPGTLIKFTAPTGYHFMADNPTN